MFKRTNRDVVNRRAQGQHWISACTAVEDQIEAESAGEFSLKGLGDDFAGVPSDRVPQEALRKP